MERERKTGFLYELSPIDIWYGWQKIGVEKFNVEGLPEDIIDQHPEVNSDPIGHNSVEEIHLPKTIWEMIVRAFYLAGTNSRWQGDVREGIYLTALPYAVYGELCPMAIAWKQDHAGETFVYADIELPWLKEFQVYPK
jgi:hypothetical protein